MKAPSITTIEERHISQLVGHFEDNIEWFSLVLDRVKGPIQTSRQLQPFIHSMKWRVKHPDHLRDKLRRRLLECKKSKKTFGINKSNLFTQINDLAGLRILHLYSQQIDSINANLIDALFEGQLKLIEGPVARAWDDESRAFFQRIGIKAVPSERMYTSVHYVVQANMRTPYTCEIQVRTLMEEVWGEVDHTINYPHKTQDISCSEQIAALARLTSGCGRLVDSIFRSHAATQAPPKRRSKKN